MHVDDELVSADGSLRLRVHADGALVCHNPGRADGNAGYNNGAGDWFRYSLDGVPVRSHGDVIDWHDAPAALHPEFYSVLSRVNLSAPSDVVAAYAGSRDYTSMMNMLACWCNDAAGELTGEPWVDETVIARTADRVRIVFTLVERYGVSIVKLLDAGVELRDLASMLVMINAGVYRDTCWLLRAGFEYEPVNYTSGCYRSPSMHTRMDDRLNYMVTFPVHKKWNGAGNLAERSIDDLESMIPFGAFIPNYPVFTDDSTRILETYGCERINRLVLTMRSVNYDANHCSIHTARSCVRIIIDSMDAELVDTLTTVFNAASIDTRTITKSMLTREWLEEHKSIPADTLKEGLRSQAFL